MNRLAPVVIGEGAAVWRTGLPSNWLKAALLAVICSMTRSFRRDKKDCLLKTLVLDSDVRVVPDVRTAVEPLRDLAGRCQPSSGSESGTAGSVPAETDTNVFKGLLPV